MTIRQLFSSAALALLLLGPALHAETSSDNVLSLNGKWKFALAKDEKQAGALENFYRDGKLVRKFSDIEVPSNWAMQGFEEPNYRNFKDNKGSEGFYLKTFATPEGWTDKRVLLKFGGVWQSCDIWLNGTFVGEHHNGFTSFAVDVSGLLDRDEPNTLAVRVKQTGFGFRLDVYDDWSLGGIFRDVTLEAMPHDRWIEYVKAVTSFDQFYRDATLEVKVMVGDQQKLPGGGNYPKPTSDYQLDIRLETFDGQTVTSRRLDVGGHVLTSRESVVSLQVENPRKWTAETPELYRLAVELIEDGESVQSWSERIGFREISTKNGVLTLNGQPIKLRGVNRHDEHPDVGRATRREHWLKDLLMMKEANINYIRCAHYTPARGFIELCDSLGFYVGNEVAFGGGAASDYNPALLGYGLQRSYETVMRDINSPSIIYWSVSNESPLSEIQLATIKNVKSLDPTRGVLMPWRFESWMPEETDLLSIHYWHAHEYDSLAGNSNRPIITTEYTHAYGYTGMGGLEERWKALTRHPAGAGGAVWMWADQGLRLKTRTPGFKSNSLNRGDDRLRISSEGWDGITDSYRNPTSDFYELKAVYAQVYPGVESVTFTPGEEEVWIPIQNDFDFTNLDKIAIRWKVFEDGTLLGEGESRISGAPHASSLMRLPLGFKSSPAGCCYAQLSFVEDNGHEISRKAVELIPRFPAKAVRTESREVKVTESPEAVVVSLGGAEVEISRRTGQIETISHEGRKLSASVHPDIWRDWDDCEVTSVGKANRDLHRDYDAYSPELLSMSRDSKGDAVRILSKVRYNFEDCTDNFTVDYVYTFSPDGSVRIHYSMDTSLQTEYLPWVGLRMDFAGKAPEISWLGLGPEDAFPNRKSAPVLGYYKYSPDGFLPYSVKQTRRVDCLFYEGKLQIFNGGTYMAADADGIGIYSEVYPRPEKGRKAAEHWFPSLKTGEKAFVGEFEFRIQNSL